MNYRQPSRNLRITKNLILNAIENTRSERSRDSNTLQRSSLYIPGAKLMTRLVTEIDIFESRRHINLHRPGRQTRSDILHNSPRHSVARYAPQLPTTPRIDTAIIIKLSDRFCARDVAHNLKLSWQRESLARHGMQTAAAAVRADRHARAKSVPGARRHPGAGLRSSCNIQGCGDSPG